MKRTLIAGTLLALTSGAVNAANVHDVTWVRKAVSVGTAVKIGGQDYVLVRLPMKEFTNGNRYVVEYLTPAFLVNPGPPAVYSFVSDLTTVHSNEALVDPVTVSGYPARIEVGDARSYQYNANSGFGDGLQVDAQVFGTVTIKVGDTTLTLSTAFTAEQQSLTTVTQDYTASPNAQWGSYTDPTVLVGYFDNWIDYIRVLKIN